MLTNNGSHNLKTFSKRSNKSLTKLLCNVKREKIISIKPAKISI